MTQGCFSVLVVFQDVGFHKKNIQNSFKDFLSQVKENRCFDGSVANEKLNYLLLFSTSRFSFLFIFNVD